MLDLLKRCFADQVDSKKWQAKLKEIIPSCGQSLAADKELCMKVRADTSEVLGLQFVPEYS